MIASCEKLDTSAEGLLFDNVCCKTVSLVQDELGYDWVISKADIFSDVLLDDKFTQAYLEESTAFVKFDVVGSTDPVNICRRELF